MIVRLPALLPPKPTDAVSATIASHRRVLDMAKIIRLPKVQEKTGLSRSTIYEYLKHRNFPAQIRLGARAIGFVESEIDEWIEARIADSRKDVA